MSKEIMQQALKALKKAKDDADNYLVTTQQDARIMGYIADLIEAELAKPEQNFCQRCGKRLGDGIHTCTPPEQEQEPVAWMNPYGGQTLTSHSMQHFACGLEKKTYTIPLYTAPPKREWQGLTDKEIINTANSAPFEDMVKADDYIYVLARAIEAKLREKNG